MRCSVFHPFPASVFDSSVARDSSDFPESHVFDKRILGRRVRLVARLSAWIDLSFYGLTLLHEDLGQINIGVSEDAGGRIGKPAVKVDEKYRSHPSIMTFGNLYETGRFKEKRFYLPFWTADKEFTETDL